MLYCVSFAGPEGPPQNFEAESVNPQNVTLMWSKPQVPNGIITHYELMYTNESNSSGTVQVNTTFYVVEGLNEFTNYTFMVAAVTIAGSGPSESLIVTTAEAG